MKISECKYHHEGSWLSIPEISLTLVSVRPWLSDPRAESHVELCNAGMRSLLMKRG